MCELHTHSFIHLSVYYTYTTGCVAQILVRAHEQFEAFMDQQQFRVDHQVLMVVLKTLAKIGPHADPVFRDECEEKLNLDVIQNHFTVTILCLPPSLSIAFPLSLSSTSVIIMRLAEVAIENSKADNLTKRKDIALALLEAYRNISECCILLVM